FIQTVIVWNLIAYPIAVAVWAWLILSLRRSFHRLGRTEVIPAEELDRVRRRLVHLPWFGAAISGGAWFIGAVVFLVSLATTGRAMSAQLFWHLPISFGVSGFIATTQSFFLIEWTSQWGLYSLFFHDARPDRLEGIHPISLRTRGFMWAVSASVCPIVSLLLLLFAPSSSGTNPQSFGIFVAVIGVAFALFSALLIGRSVAQPVDELRTAAQSVTQGQLDVQVPLRRAEGIGSVVWGGHHIMSQGRSRTRD